MWNHKNDRLNISIFLRLSEVVIIGWKTTIMKLDFFLGQKMSQPIRTNSDVSVLRTMSTLLNLVVPNSVFIAK